MAELEITIERQRELIGRLARLAARRLQEEDEIGRRDALRRAEAAATEARERSLASAAFAERHAQLIREYQDTRERLYARYEAEGFVPADEETRFVHKETQRMADGIEDAKQLRQLKYDQIQKDYDERRVVPQAEFAQFQQQTEYALGEVNALVVQAQSVVRRRCEWPSEDSAPAAEIPAGLPRPEYMQRYAISSAEAFRRLHELQQQPMAKFLEDGWPLLIFLFAIPAYIALFWLVASSLGWGWIIGGGVTAAAITAVAVRAVVRPMAKRGTLRIVPEFQRATAAARGCLAAALQAARAEAEAKQRRLVEQRDADHAAAKADYKETRRLLKTSHEANMSEAELRFATERQRVETTFEPKIDEIEQGFPPRIAALERNFEAQMRSLSAAYRGQIEAADTALVNDRQALTRRWGEALAEFETEVGGMNAYCNEYFPDWSAVVAKSANAGKKTPVKVDAPTTSSGPAALRFGRFDADLNALGVRLPDGETRRLPASGITFPAVLSYPQCPSLLLKAEDDGRDAAAEVIRNVMLRLLTSLPAGKVRFTIIDPVGLGQNFSAFMHLADYDERLITNRIWTEGTHIHQRLTDLTEHMENVIQKYLRNEFASIQEYNAHAGEVAEPFHILVVANFPAGFSEEAARRLVSIAASGAKCGVYTLISVDERLKPPRNFQVEDLEKNAATLAWNSAAKSFRYVYEDLASLPLQLEAPPPDEQFTEIIRAVGAAAKDAARVEVPFDFVTPDKSEWWTKDSRAGIEVPLGRAGAKALQYMRLGKGTSQHVLISGKTGSGKSTLLNSVITNLGLHYSPDELEFYLIDFKKGVEFKAYAVHHLPHARVIAIESEREFGMSVLERLDLELKRRGDLFRKHGVQDVKGYRGAVPDAVMPRILLIIDEFQEFFTSDDRVSHDSALLLDRLVRQGRAFGIHLILGSQTLAGAYSLARSTIGQMAVRIALQCSESDAHLILSEDNTAARLLSRPGEAIYNDANGLFEGNHPFQVVWLSDEQRESYLQQIYALSDERHLDRPPPIVFEGNAAADAAENHLLRGVLESSPSTSASAPQAWLGAAVAVKDPTTVTFRRQSGGNLLVVGQQEELALGMLATAFVALAGQLKFVPRLPSANPEDFGDRRFVVLDGTRPDAPEAGFWARVLERAGVDAVVVPHRQTTKAITDIAQEVDRRLASGDHAAEPIFLFVHNLARFRDLKKTEDFSFDEDEGGAGAGKRLATILREGPPLGVHTLVWCDSYNNLNRWFDRQTLRDFELRVLFQMSASDSSNLMDSPAASRLGPHMTLFYSEELGQAEKLRPYGLPTAEWLAWVQEKFAARNSAAGDSQMSSLELSPES